MYTFLMVLFVILSIFLASLILIQQGKGDMGLGSLGGSTQMLFGGSGGQGFFEKATWILGFLFIFGSLGLAVLKSKMVRQSKLEGFTMQEKKSVMPEAPAALPIQAIEEESAAEETAKN